MLNALHSEKAFRQHALICATVEVDRVVVVLFDVFDEEEVVYDAVFAAEVF